MALTGILLSSTPAGHQAVATAFTQTSVDALLSRSGNSTFYLRVRIRGDSMLQEGQQFGKSTVSKMLLLHLVPQQTHVMVLVNRSINCI